MLQKDVYNTSLVFTPRSLNLGWGAVALSGHLPESFTGRYYAQLFVKVLLSALNCYSRQPHLSLQCLHLEPGSCQAAQA